MATLALALAVYGGVIELVEVAIAMKTERRAQTESVFTAVVCVD